MQNVNQLFQQSGLSRIQVRSFVELKLLFQKWPCSHDWCGQDSLDQQNLKTKT